MLRCKQPSSLYNLCVKKCVTNINSACEDIVKRYPDSEVNECQREILLLKSYLMLNIPGRLFDVFCSRWNDMINYRSYTNHSHVFTYLMMHPNMTVFRLHIDHYEPPDCMKLSQLWTDHLPQLTQLVVLDVPNMCTDEILKIISVNCILLEELNAVSASGKNVSDEGLSYLTNLTRLRILKLDDCYCKYNDRHKRVTRDGIIALVKELPNLEELNVPHAGRIVTSSPSNIGPLALKTISFKFPTIGDITKLATICPLLNELTLKTDRITDVIRSPSIIKEISDSNLKLSKLRLRNFCITRTIQHLKCKGFYLTHLFLDSNDSINFGNLLLIGIYCPHLQNLYIRNRILAFPKGYRQMNNIFLKLERLEFRCDKFSIKSIVSFFVECSKDLQTLSIITNNCYLDVNDTLMFLLNNGNLKNIEQLWLSPYFIVSQNVIISIISRCEKLRTFSFGLDFVEHADIVMVEISNFIEDNNLDMEIIDRRNYRLCNRLIYDNDFRFEFE